MYMPPPKTGQGSGNALSNTVVLRAAELLQQAAKEAAVVTEPNQERTQEAPSSPDSEELFEDNKVAILMKRITTVAPGKNPQSS
ncbi:hypothetical protein Hanom_Chr12g01093211 [Helianthus anomalus]